MTVFYSASSNGFYNSDLKDVYIQAQTWPSDAVEISDRWYKYLIDGQEKGMVITANEYGQPALIDPPPLTKEKLIDAAEAKKQNLLSEATVAIAPLQDAVDLKIATENEISKLQDWKEYRVALNRTDTSSAPNVNWPVRPE
ncbi:tail fiber assembly protein [Enterobacter cloacae]|nr:tail fiber assembly protein [Enterobacter cloacae]MCM7493842.1 tail fiber assembly protein [Enterobacter cloacae]UJC65779.1 tail fiber assembly protein [Enterobacter cloacae]HDC4262635.1 tail fiber assembly protein [Enterobacter cloacae]